MKRFYLTLLSSLLIVTLAFLGIPRAEADDAAIDYLIGDADEDNSLTILDATAIQRRLANLRILTQLQEFLSDVDGDKSLTILDATAIQRRLADLGDEFWQSSITKNHFQWQRIGYYSRFPQIIYNDAVLCDTEARIEFYSINYRYNKKTYPTLFDVYINDRIILNRAQQNYIDYLFEKAGVYRIKVVPFTLFGKEEPETIQITVQDSPERPYIADARYNADDNTVSVRAAGGAGGYRYAYYIKHEIPMQPSTEGDPQAPPPTEPPFTPIQDPDGTYQMVTDYIDAPIIRIPDQILNEELMYYFYVSVIDKNGAESSLSQVLD